MKTYAISLWTIVLLACGLAGAAEETKVPIKWVGPLHLLDDFGKRPECRGLAAKVKVESERFAVTIEHAAFSVPGPYKWFVLDGKGSILHEGATRTGKNAVKESCKAIHKELLKEKP